MVKYVNKSNEINYIEFYKHQVEGYQNGGIFCLRTATKQAGLAFISKTLGYILGFISQAIFVHLLGVKQYGLFSLGLTIVNVGVLFAVFGMNMGATRFLGEYLGKREFGKAKGVISQCYF